MCTSPAHKIESFIEGILEIDNILLEKCNKKRKNSLFKLQWMLGILIALAGATIMFHEMKIFLLTVIGFGEEVVGWNIHGLLASITLGIIIFMFSVFLWSIWRKRLEKQRGLSVKDERTMYIKGRAAYYALHVGTWFMLGLLWYSFLGTKMFGLPTLETAPALIMSSLICSGLFLGLRWYFDRRGDVT